MKNKISRRSFLGTTVLGAVALPAALDRMLAADAAPAAAATSTPAIPVIDTHIHLFDPFRPGGAPWPSAKNPAHAVMYSPPRGARLGNVGQMVRHSRERKGPRTPARPNLLTY